MTLWETLWFYMWVILGAVGMNAFLIWRHSRRHRRRK